EGHITRHVTRQTGRQTRRSARPVRDPSLIGYSPGYQTSRPRWGRRSVSEGDRTPPVPNRLREHRLARGLDQWAVAERINALTEDGTPLDEKAVSRHERGLHKPRRFYRQLYCEPAPRGALSYPRSSREELEGRFLGLMAYLARKRRRGTTACQEN